MPAPTFLPVRSPSRIACSQRRGSHSRALFLTNLAALAA